MRLIPDTIRNLATLIDYVKLCFEPDDAALLIRLLEEEYDALEASREAA